MRAEIKIMMDDQGEIAYLFDGSAPVILGLLEMASLKVKDRIVSGRYDIPQEKEQPNEN